jgi:hypothetical protein
VHLDSPVENRIAIGGAATDLPKQRPHGHFLDLGYRGQAIDLIGERGGTRTLDPMIKSHVLYRLSYALTCRAV